MGSTGVARSVSDTWRQKQREKLLKEQSELVLCVHVIMYRRCFKMAQICQVIPTALILLFQPAPLPLEHVSKELHVSVVQHMYNNPRWSLLLALFIQLPLEFQKHLTLFATYACQPWQRTMMSFVSPCTPGI